MKLTVVGTGYVGLVTGVCFAEMGNEVWCVDVDKEKIQGLNQGKIPIYEPGLEDMVKRNMEAGRLHFTTRLEEGLSLSLFLFIAVGTPPGEDGSADLNYVLSVAREVGRKMERYVVLVDKSTVPVGTADKVREAVAEELKARGKGGLEFDVVSNPEFLKEGAAIDDVMKPDRIIVGTDNVRTAELMKELYSPFVRNGHPILLMDIHSAELAKYAANAMLATRISFMNELAALCEKVGADIEQVRMGIGSDRRIGNAFLYAGLGYGGSCFPKDVKALIHSSREEGLKPTILEAVEEVNKRQRQIFVERIKGYFGSLRGKKLALWGLSFKPQTDDMREAPSVTIAERLLQEGALLTAYDPVAVEVARLLLPSEGITFTKDAYEGLKDADALLLITEWHQFRNPDFERIKGLMKTPVIFDGRNQYDPKVLRSYGYTYFCLGRRQCI